ncbi:hypothetical protein CLF_103514 [Clonorchis sinensis]|uniref:Uncharacterized protein n=1 Tax=Clonorchis sinensis TaxID=79923 RepID=G7Y9W4_CLOSI|nr:hypothetical protein CLF_103514 [Clonorchis sinensis]
MEHAIRSTNGPYRFALVYCMSTIRPKDVADPTSVYCVFERIQFDISDLSDTCMDLIAHELTRVFNPKNKPLVTVSEHYWIGSPSISPLINESSRVVHRFGGPEYQEEEMGSKVYGTVHTKALELGPLYRNIKSVVFTELYNGNDYYFGWNGIRIYAREQDVDDEIVLKDSRKIQEIASSLLPSACSKVNVSSPRFTLDDIPHRMFRMYSKSRSPEETFIVNGGPYRSQYVTLTSPFGCSMTKLEKTEVVTVFISVVHNLVSAVRQSSPYNPTCSVFPQLPQSLETEKGGQMLGFASRVRFYYISIANINLLQHITSVVFVQIERSVLGGKLSDYFLTARVDSFAVRADIAIFALSEITFDAAKLSKGVTPMDVFVFSSEVYAQLENGLRNLDASYPFVIHSISIVRLAYQSLEEQRFWDIIVEYFDVFRKAQLSDAQNHKPEIVNS